MSAAATDTDPVAQLGERLRVARKQGDLSLREMARNLGVSPSFLSQLENGKTQPSVATLYSIAQLLGISIDELFAPTTVGAASGAAHLSARDPLHATVNRLALGSPAEAWPTHPVSNRYSHVTPETRARLVMDTGVVWEQLAENNDHELDFMEIVYPPGSSSTTDGRMLRHHGTEYGYLLSGELEITLGFEKFTLRAGESMSLNSSIPHLLTNTGAVPARGVWAVHHCSANEGEASVQ